MSLFLFPFMMLGIVYAYMSLMNAPRRQPVVLQRVSRKGSRRR